MASSWNPALISSGSYVKNPLAMFSSLARPPPLPLSPGDVPPICASRIAFNDHGLPEYSQRYALIIDNLFTPDDCDRLLSAATTYAPWVPAKVNAGGGREYENDAYRRSGRILLDDQTLADWILEKIRPYLSDIEVVANPYAHERFKGSQDSKEHITSAFLTRLNERLRFFRYKPGEYFRPHCDGTYFTPDRKEASYYTLQIYLNGNEKSVKGGATRFWPYRSKLRYNSKSKLTSEKPMHFVDVAARLGRVLIFEQNTLLHSGEEVLGGLKYSIRTDFMYIQKEVDAAGETLL